MKKVIISVAVALVVIGGGIFLMLRDNGQAPAGNSTSLNNDFSAVPGDTELRANLNKAGLDALTAEGSVLHIHQHLDLVVNGQNITIPAEIGVSTAFISPVHTHDTSGIIHVESPVQKDFKLSQFFTEWGIDLNDKCVGPNCADATHKLVVAVNGTPVDHVADIVLHSHDEIEIWYGDKNTNPDLIKSYNFPEGY